MSNLLVNILRRSKIYIISSKTIESVLPALPTLIHQKDFYLNCGHLYQKVSNEDGKAEAAKKAKEVKITLLGKNDSMTITSLEEAQKLSRRRDLKLVKVQDIDVKTQRPVYKMVTASDLFAEEAEESAGPGASKGSGSTKKSEKLLTIGSRISDHDLASRMKNIGKWLAKGHEVRILIQCGMEDLQSGEKIFASMENSAKESGGRVVQKRVKGGHIRFIILPTNPPKQL